MIMDFDLLKEIDREGVSGAKRAVSLPAPPVLPKDENLQRKLRSKVNNYKVLEVQDDVFVMFYYPNSNSRSRIPHQLHLRLECLFCSPSRAACFVYCILFIRDL